MTELQLEDLVYYLSERSASISTNKKVTNEMLEQIQIKIMEIMGLEEKIRPSLDEALEYFKGLGLLTRENPFEMRANALTMQISRLPTAWLMRTSLEKQLEQNQEKVKLFAELLKQDPSGDAEKMIEEVESQFSLKRKRTDESTQSPSAGSSSSSSTNDEREQSLPKKRRRK